MKSAGRPDRLSRSMRTVLSHLSHRGSCLGWSIQKNILFSFCLTSWLSRNWKSCYDDAAYLWCELLTNSAVTVTVYTVKTSFRFYKKIGITFLVTRVALMYYASVLHCALYSISGSKQFRQCPTKFNSQQGYAGQCAQVQKLLVDATQAGLKPACNNCPEC